MHRARHGERPPRRVRRRPRCGTRDAPRAVRGGFHCAHGRTLLGTGMESPTHASELIRQLALWSVPLLAAVIFHEVAHGVVALRLGDDTAQRAGRLTLNPLPHIDPIGTVLLPALLLVAHAPVFGYAKPVPVNYARLRDPRRSMVLVALAGPLTNLVLAATSAFVLRQLLA